MTRDFNEDEQESTPLWVIILAGGLIAGGFLLVLLNGGVFR